ncbi:MAG: gliding motility-associated ABC transporter substrate-binding protein GldG, partial [Mangrovimonas sp.]|nr:gliding motility-associated ABC transporter substrate-binding protein GldG [Mangrovimonas sp.]
DQYVMNGGKSLWLMDEVAIDMDSLNANGKSYAIPLDLNLTDFFFKYGVRINPVLVNDLYSARITLATGEGSQAQFSDYPWFYSPLVTSDNQHPIVNNINLVKFDFANQIDTLNQSNNSVNKTVLLHSSILSKVDGTPREIDLAMVMQEPDPKEYTNGYIPLAVLLEGQFTSVYKNRVKPLSLKPTKDESVPTKMIVISDGDVIKNEVGRNGPEELGFNKRTGQLYGNKEFLLNAVNYLLDDNGLINIRSKQIQIAFLDHEKVAAEKTKWQLLNILLPLGLLGLFGLAFNFIRRRRYAA